MPKRDTAPAGAPCWIDLATSDVDKSRAFYEELFGWTSEDAGQEYGHYINFSKDEVPVAGAMTNPAVGEMPDGWSIYLACADAAKTVEDATTNGGEAMLPAMDVSSLGRMAFVFDAGHAAIGLWQPGDHKGFGVFDEPDTPGWFELHTRDYDATVAFYQKVFGWNTHVEGDTPEFRYTTLIDGEAQLAGVMDASGFLPEGVPAHWSVYFRVENTDKALARAADLGGATVMPAENTPYGRLATASDPTGALFKFVGLS
jgi:predicted enzyme related to lactoylglutathione lyase